MIEASYIVLEYIKQQVDQMIAPDTLTMHPGRFAAQTSDISSATYNVRLGVNFGQPYVSTDAISLTIYHQEYHTLQRILGHLVTKLNPEHAKENPALYSSGIDEDVKFLMIAAVVGRQDNSAFIEGTEYFVATIDILIEYVRLSGPDLESDQLMYIEGDA